MKTARILSCLLLVWGCSDDGQVGRDLGGDLQKPDTFRYKLDTGYVPPDKGKPDQAPPIKDMQQPDKGSGVRAAPFTLNFDTDNGNLKGTKDWEWGKIAFVKGTNCVSDPAAPKSGHSGMGMWGTKLNDCHNPLSNNETSGASCSNKNPNDDSILSFKASIPATFKYASLIFYHWTDVFYPYDWHEVRVIEGGQAKVLRQYGCKSSHTKPTAWAYQSIFLDPYIGKTITIQFHFMASGGVNHAGWYIDDVSIKDQ